MAATYNPLGQNTTQFNSAIENRGLFSRILRNLSSWGMNYDDMIMRNQVGVGINEDPYTCLLYTSPSPRDRQKSRMPSSA